MTGTILEGSQSCFRGCPQSPLSRNELFDKFERLCESMDAQRRVALFESLWNVESAPNLSRLAL